MVNILENMHNYQNPLGKKTNSNSDGKKPIAIIISTCSDDGFLDNDHYKLYQDTIKKYKDLKYSILNPNTEILYNRDSGTIKSIKEENDIPALCDKISQLKKQSKVQKLNVEELTIIISSHGQLEDFLGKTPGRERNYMQKLSNALNKFSSELGLKVGNVILEACYSSLELEIENNKLKSFSGESPARTLSNAFYNQNITNVNVWGYPGKVSINKVQYNEDRASSGSALDDIVGFKNGDVIKAVNQRYDHNIHIGLSDRRTERQKQELQQINPKIAKHFNR